MSYAIIDFGNPAQALAKAFARSDMEVSVATTRAPESFASNAAAIGPTILPKTLAEAVKADTVFLAFRFESYREAAKALPSWQEKIVVDVTNAYGVSPDELVEQSSAKTVAQAFTGARLVKGFNHLVAGVLDQDPAVHGAGEWCSWQATTTAPQMRSARLRKISVSRRSNLAGVGRRAARPGARKQLGSADLQGPGQIRLTRKTDPQAAQRRNSHEH
jgi:hypothetical protein